MLSSPGVAFASTNPAGGLVAADPGWVCAVARAVAVRPVEFPGFGEPGPAQSRVTISRAETAAARLTPDRMRLVRRGMSELAGANVATTTADGVVLAAGRVFRAKGAAVDAALRALVAVAVATVSAHYDPNADAPAELWLSFARSYCLRVPR
ncbi:hypothetical protein [Amycolatopsis sp. NPDC059021]|uniref:hypothetical protein n=1 Tax=Amycolatopsis sp. NPDC059021 TaxID=3346704 RepID=UPI0036707C91